MQQKHAEPNRRERRAAAAGGVAAPPALYMTIPRLSAHLGVPIRRLRNLIRNGTLPAYSFGSAWWRCRVDEAERALRETRVRPTDHAARRVQEMLDSERGT